MRPQLQALARQSLARQSRLMVSPAMSDASKWQLQNKSQPMQLQQAASASTAVATVNKGKHWAFERVITLGLVGVIPGSFVFYHPVMDYVLALGLCMHSHWGLHGVCCDYIRPKLFGAALAKLAEVIVYILSFLAFGSVMYFNYTDVGLIPAMKMLWKL